MDLKKKITTSRLVTPLKTCVVAIFFFMVATAWQYMQIVRKDHRISVLLTENETLKKDLLSIDEELLEIKDAASDVRVFQKELMKVMKDIDPNHSVKLASRSNAKPSCGFSDSEGIDHDEVLSSAKESIFFLSNTQEKLRFDAAGLLGRAVSIRDAFSTTPSMIPLNGGYISSEFGPRIDPITRTVKRHYGIDFAAPIGTPVYASADGVVKRATLDREFGNVVEIFHPSGHVTTYGHLSEILTKTNSQVKRGDQIGRVGNTGLRCVGAHLHFGVSKNGVKENPKKFLLTSPPNYF